MTDREIIHLHRAWWRGDLDHGDYVDRLGDVDPDRYGRLLRRETVRELAPGALIVAVLVGLALGVENNDHPWDTILAWVMVPLFGLASWWCCRELTRCVSRIRELRAYRRPREANGR